MKKILVKQKNNCTIITTDEILFCNSLDGYTTINLQNGQKITHTKGLKSFAQELDDDFIRISQSCIVNAHYIREILYSTKEVLLRSGDKCKFTLNVNELHTKIETKFSAKKV